MTVFSKPLIEWPKITFSSLFHIKYYLLVFISAETVTVLYIPLIVNPMTQTELKPAHKFCNLKNPLGFVRKKSPNNDPEEEPLRGTVQKNYRKKCTRRLPVTVCLTVSA